MHIMLRLFFALVVVALNCVSPAEAMQLSRYATTSALPPQAASSVVYNADVSSNYIYKIDNGYSVIDAHDYQIIQVGNRFYWYGTSYGCGFQYSVSGPFCGFNIYASSDLQHWDYVGQPFNPSAYQTRCSSPNNGCFRFKVVYNASTNLWVAWFNDASLTKGYAVMTATSPIGPFTEQTPPTMQANGAGIDENLFVDGNGDGYLIWSPAVGSAVFIAKLNADYLDISASQVTASTANNEAPSLFTDGTTYYAVHGPKCAYCNSTATQYQTASSPLGTWSALTTINSTSCGGQPSNATRLSVGGKSLYLYGSDQWVQSDNNQSLATQFMAPLSVSGGAIGAISCIANFTTGTPAVPPPTPPIGVDQTPSVPPQYIPFCNTGDLGGGSFQQMQTFTPTATGVLQNISILVGKGVQAGVGGTGPNGNLVVKLVTLAGGVPSGAPSGTLGTISVTPASLSWSPKRVTLNFAVSVTSGTAYGIVLSSPTNTSGCFSYGYNVQLAYAAGLGRYSTNGGSTFTTISNRTYFFQSTIP